MDWIRLKLADAIGGNQPISKKLLFAVISVVAAAVLLLNSIFSSETQEISIDASVDGPTSVDEVVVENAKIYVHVVGEVDTPGIYELESGARLMDAIFAAGGLAESADQASVNLARELTDGEQVVVFKSGENPIAAGGSSGAKTQISLNRASQAELEDLPGVGPALAGRIVDWRSANGGFKSKEDLLNISGIGAKLFAGIKDEVVL